MDRAAFIRRKKEGKRKGRKHEIHKGKPLCLWGGGGGGGGVVGGWWGGPSGSLEGCRSIAGRARIQGNILGLACFSGGEEVICWEKDGKTNHAQGGGSSA